MRHKRPDLYWGGAHEPFEASVVVLSRDEIAEPEGIRYLEEWEPRVARPCIRRVYDAWGGCAPSPVATSASRASCGSDLEPVLFMMEAR